MSMSEAELRRIAGIGRDYANRDIQHIRSSTENLLSPAFTNLPEKIQKSGFSTKGDRDSVISTVQAIQQFIGSEGSTLRSAKAFFTESVRKVGEEVKKKKTVYHLFNAETGQWEIASRQKDGSALTAKQVGRAWDIFHMWQQQHGTGQYSILSAINQFVVKNRSERNVEALYDMFEKESVSAILAGNTGEMKSSGGIIFTKEDFGQYSRRKK